MFQRLMALLAASYALAVPRAACTTAGTSGAPALRDLDARAEVHGQVARSAADGWLRAQALIPGGQGPQ
jgi:hypothetical protein